VDRIDYPASALTAALPDGQTAILDRESVHDTIFVQDMFSVTDGIGNNAGSDLNYWRVDVGVFLANEDGTASDAVFPGASARIRSNTDVEVAFDLAQITEAQSAAVVKASIGDVSAETLINLRKVTQVAGAVPFVPIPFVDARAAYVEVTLEDQAGALIAPVAEGAGINIECSVVPSADGTIAGGAEASGYAAGVLPLVFDSYANRENYLIVGPVADLLTETNPAVDVALETTRYGSAVVQVSFVPDFVPPEVGALTVIDCGFTVAISDNVAVNGAATQVSVTDSVGDAVEDLEITAVDSDNGSLVTVKTLQPGTYRAIITAKDLANNLSDPVEKLFTVTTCEGVEPPVPSCVSVNPAFAEFGETLDVTVTVANMTVDNETDVTFSLADITVNSITVLSETEVDVNITVADNATEGVADVTVTSGEVSVTCAGAFEVIEPEEPPITCELTVFPASVRSAIFFPQVRVLNIRGEGIAATDTVAFESADIVPIVTLPGLPGRINVLVLVKAGAAKGTFEVTVGDCVGEVTIR
jgi:hypothetical protein